jgi:hypothetical protein
VTLAVELDRAIAAASSMAGEGEQLAAVMPAQPITGQTVYLSAFERGDALSYVVLDDAGEIVSDRRVVADAVAVLAMAERAEEVAAAPAADDLALVFTDLATALAKLDPDAAAAASAVAAAATETGAAAAGPRAASPAYLDRIAHVAGGLGATLDVFEQHAERLAAAAATDPAMAEPAATAWQALALAARSGDPAGFAQAMTAVTGSMDALVDEVIEHYRVGLS